MINILSILLIFGFHGFHFNPLQAGVYDEPERYSINIKPNGSVNSYVVEINLPNTSFVKLNLTDEKNKIVKTLLNENMKSGKYELMPVINDLKKGKYKLNFRARNYYETKEVIIE
jgi:5-hydroxyisourate hydrolase-like protein (transthyretin family)